MTSPLPPAVLLVFGALLIPLLRGPLKSIYVLALPILGLVNLMNLTPEMSWRMAFLDYELVFAQVDKMSLVFGCVFHLVAFMGALYMLNFKDDLQLVAGLIYAGSATGVAFAGDFFTFYVFWEMLTVCAVFLIWARKSEHAVRAGYRYLLFHVVGGLILLAGIILRVHDTGSIAFGYIGLDGSTASLLIFLGMGINAAWPTLHTWVVDAYPASTIGGVIFLSALTTKTAVYALARAFPGAQPLIWIGCVMLAFPVFFAVIENDLRKVLSYSLINQVGFMMVGIGIGTELSINGAVAHAFTHIIYKSLLFMSMGAVLFRVGTTKATELGGLYKSMPITTICCLIGAASISGIPGLSGFISKSMVVTASAEGHMLLVYLALLFASAGVLEHAGIKVPFFAFFAHDSGKRVKEAPLNMVLAMLVASFLCIILGIFPKYLYQNLPFAVPYEPYTVEHVVGQFQLLGFAGLAFCLLLLAGLYPPERRAVNLDVDWFYRGIAAAFYRTADCTMNRINLMADRSIAKGLTGKINGFFSDAPTRVADAACRAYWKASHLSDEEIVKRRAALQVALDRKTLPISFTGATTLLFILIMFFM